MEKNDRIGRAFAKNGRIFMEKRSQAFQYHSKQSELSVGKLSGHAGMDRPDVWYSDIAR
jgi:hypothetical protein